MVDFGEAFDPMAGESGLGIGRGHRFGNGILSYPIFNQIEGDCVVALNALANSMDFLVSKMGSRPKRVSDFLTRKSIDRKCF